MMMEVITVLPYNVQNLKKEISMHRCGIKTQKLPLIFPGGYEAVKTEVDAGRPIVLHLNSNV